MTATNKDIPHDDEKVIYAISDGKICRLTKTENGTQKEVLDSAVLTSYLDRLRETANRNEWKNSGSGARFTGVFVPGTDAASRVRAVSSAVRCLGRDGDDLVYAIEIDNMAGIYRRYSDTNSGEGIVLSSGDIAYREFDMFGDDITVAAAFAGECHIGVLKKGEGAAHIYTDGASWDSQPVWSRTNPGQIYFSSAGLLVKNASGEEAEDEAGVSVFPAAMLKQLHASGVSSRHGPAALCRLDVNAGTMEELYADSGYDYLHPQSTPDGALWYIRRPYREERSNSGNPFGCLVDTLLLPFRLIGALFGFLNFFSVKYSGKTLSNAGNAKRKSEADLFLDGNMIAAEEELKRNRNHGEKNPGIVPRSWELHRRAPDGTDTLVRRGVVAFRTRPDGSLLVSNGSALLSVSPDGTEKKLSDLERVTFIL